MARASLSILPAQTEPVLFLGRSAEDSLIPAYDAENHHRDLAMGLRRLRSPLGQKLASGRTAEVQHGLADLLGTVLGLATCGLLRLMIAIWGTPRCSP
jgi:hypothetical protein